MKNKNKKTSKKMKFLIVICTLLGTGMLSLAFLLYGPYDGFRNMWITTAMTTMNHRYLATIFYSEESINKVLAKNKVIENDEDTDTSQIKFRKYTTSIYKNEYDKEVLDRDKDTLYKLIEINEATYHGYLVAIYDPSRISIATTKYLGVRGESILTVAERENAIIAMNASGFYDPDWNGNGAMPHGTVISNGKIVSTFAEANVGGGFIGFDKENKFVLARMTDQEALNAGIRDAVEFGPFLIVNGKRSFVSGNGGWGIAPRTAIGQRQDGIVLFLVIEGRLATSIGADMNDLCDVLEKYGAYNAANLDGGSSTELVINNALVNKAVAGGPNGIRTMPTFWVVK